MQKKLMFLLVMNGIYISIAADILDGNFHEFLKEIVAVEDQEKFGSFYYNLVNEQQKDIVSGKNRKQSDKTTSLRCLGWCGLEVRKPELVAKLRHDFNNPARAKKVNDFLFRYGAYEAFLKECAAKQNNIFAKTRVYFRDTKNKVFSWFSSKMRRNTIDA